MATAQQHGRHDAACGNGEALKLTSMGTIPWSSPRASSRKVFKDPGRVRQLASSLNRQNGKNQAVSSGRRAGAGKGSQPSLHVSHPLSQRHSERNASSSLRGRGSLQCVYVTSPSAPSHTCEPLLADPIEAFVRSSGETIYEATDPLTKAPRTLLLHGTAVDEGIHAGSAWGGWLECKWSDTAGMRQDDRSADVDGSARRRARAALGREAGRTRNTRGRTAAARQPERVESGCSQSRWQGSPALRNNNGGRVRALANHLTDTVGAGALCAAGSRCMVGQYVEAAETHLLMSGSLARKRWL